ncbi:uncharacterized protein LOC144582346 isoform X2 [Callithrix jacchus]
MKILKADLHWINNEYLCVPQEMENGLQSASHSTALEQRGYRIQGDKFWRLGSPRSRCWHLAARALLLHHHMSKKKAWSKEVTL